MTPPNHAEVAPVGHPCLIHGDTVPNNFIQSVDALVLIDWQCPALGDPVLDLAIFLSPAMQQIARGRVRELGREGMLEFVNRKTVWIA